MRKREEAHFKGRGHGEGAGCGTRLDPEAPKAGPSARRLGSAGRRPASPLTRAWLPASLTRARPRGHAAAAAAAAAAGQGLLGGALGGGGGGHAIGRALLAPVQVAAPGDVWGSGHPVAQLRPGAEGPCREGHAKAALIPRTPAIAQAIEPVRAPRMHRRRGRTRRALWSPPRLGPRRPRAARFSLHLLFLFLHCRRRRRHRVRRN